MQFLAKHLKVNSKIAQQWRWKQSKIGCAIHIIGPKYWVRKIFIFLTQSPNIGCANAHPAHPAPPHLFIVNTLDYVFCRAVQAVL